MSFHFSRKNKKYNCTCIRFSVLGIKGRYNISLEVFNHANTLLYYPLYSLFNVSYTNEPLHDKTNKKDVRPAKTGQSGHPPCLISLYCPRKNAWVLSYPLSTQRKLWSDWMDAQVNLKVFAGRITKTCLMILTPLNPFFYIVKLGFTGVYSIFIISAQKHRLWVLVRTAP